MTKILVSKELASAALRDAATTLKAAIVVSAAAILSQAQGDLEANAEAAMAHFDTFSGKLNAIRDDALDRAIGLVEARLETTRQALSTIVGSAERDGIDVFADHIGALGRAFQDVAAINDGAPLSPPFLFDQFFLESMNDLAQRDWSEGA
jgi:hypothetical protein